MLLRALGFVSDRDILELFYTREAVEVKGKKGDAGLNRVCAQDIVDESTGEILIEANDEITPEKLEILRKAGLETLEVFVIPMQDEADVVRNTLRKDPTHSQEEALNRIYNLLRPGEPPRADSAREILNKLFFNPKRYDLARVGRYKLNQKLPHEYLLPEREVRKRLALGLPDLNHSTLCREDFIVIIKYLLLLRIGRRAGHRPRGRAGDHGRHRPSRQPPRALGGRAARQPVQHRPGAHGPHHPRAHVAAGPGADHADRPGQLAHHLGGDPELLRLLASCRSSWTRPTRWPS